MEQSLSSGSLQFRGVESHMDNKNARQNDIWVQACYVGAKSRAQIIAKTDAEALLPGKVAFEQMLKKFVQNPMGLQRKGHSRPRRDPEQRQGVQKIRTIKHANIMEFCHIHLIKLHTLKNSAETFSSLETLSFHLSFFFFSFFLITVVLKMCYSASVSTGNSLEMYILRPHFRATMLESLWWVPANGSARFSR